MFNTFPAWQNALEFKEIYGNTEWQKLSFFKTIPISRLVYNAVIIWAFNWLLIHLTHWKCLKMLGSWSWKPEVLIHQATVHCSFINTEPEGFHDKLFISYSTVNALNHLVGQQDAGDGVSVGQQGLVVQVLFPMATAEEAGRAGDVKHHHTAQGAFIIDPGHGYETLLAWREDTKFTMSSIHPSLHSYIHLLKKRFCTCDVPQLQPDFFFFWPLQQLHRKIH